MSEKAQPGDMIRVTKAGDKHLGKVFLVITPGYGVYVNDTVTWVLMKSEDGSSFGGMIFHSDYEIIEKTSDGEVSQKCGNVEESLTRQRDDNLRSIFG